MENEVVLLVQGLGRAWRLQEKVLRNLYPENCQNLGRSGIAVYYAVLDENAFEVLDFAELRYYLLR